MGALIYKAPELLSLPLAPPASTERFICVMRLSPRKPIFRAHVLILLAGMLLHHYWIYRYAGTLICTASGLQ